MDREQPPAAYYTTTPNAKNSYNPYNKNNNDSTAGEYSPPLQDRDVEVEKPANPARPLEFVPPKATLDVAPEQELNMASVLKGTAANRLTLFEKKAALINA